MSRIGSAGFSALHSINNVSTLSYSQLSLDAAVYGFSQQALYGSSIAAMTAGGLAYRLGAYSLGAAYCNTFRLARFLAPVFGLACEVTAFQGTERILGESHGSFLEDWRNSFVDFGVMKSVGYFLGSQNIFFRHLSQDLSMMAGHQVTAAIGFTTQSEGSFVDQLFRAELTNLQMEVGGALAGRLSGHCVHILERNLENSHQNFQRRADFENQGNETVLASMASRRNENVNPLDVLQALYETAPPSIKSNDPVDPEYLENRVTRSIFDLLDLNQSPYHFFSREERAWLQRALSFKIQDTQYFHSRKILQALQDFEGMKRLLRSMPNEGNDYERVMIYLEDLGEPERILEEMASVSREGLQELWDAALRRHPFWQTHVADFCAEFSYKGFIGFDMIEACRSLQALSSSYDYAVAIAKGGLYSGAVAKFLGMDVTVIEVHAHNRRRPQLRLIENLDPEKIRGKRVLLLDKDVVSGATIHETLKLLAPHAPAQVGVFLNLGSLSQGEAGIGSNPDVVESFRQQGIAVHYPGNVRPLPFRDLFYQVHERLKTPFGRLRKVLRDWEETLRSIQGLDPEHLDIIRQYLDRRQQVYADLNHFLPGTEEIRQRIIGNLEKNLQDLKVYQEVALPEFPPSKICNILRHEADLPNGFAEAWAKGRYQDRGQEWLQEKKVESQHRPHNYLEAFHCAQRAMKDRYDYVLLVGPEAFPYAPLFEDLGLPIVSVNIPEADYGGMRSFRSFDDLSVLWGKRVLVVEDDVQSGATLEKLLQEISPHAPRFLGLYLGSRPTYQIQSNIPKIFRKVYVNDGDTEVAERAFLKHLKSRSPLFKSKRRLPGV